MSVGAFADAAEALWRHGLAPLPLGGDDGKQPAIRGFTLWRRRPGLATIKEWRDHHPQANIGVVTGALSHVTVIDIDDARLVPAMVERFGPTPVQIATPRGGRHLWYRFNGERSGSLRGEGLEVDIRGTGGIVATPPSERTCEPFRGLRYTISCGSWGELANLPRIRSGALRPVSAARPIATADRARGCIPVGQRNDALFKFCLRQTRYCDDLDSLVDCARTYVANQFALSATRPFSDNEIMKTAGSAWRYEVEGRNWVGGQARISLTATEITILASQRRGADAMMLLSILRRSNWDRPEFPAAPEAMAAAGLITGWGHCRYRKALLVLIETRLLEVSHKGGRRRGDARLYTFASLRAEARVSQ